RKAQDEPKDTTPREGEGQPPEPKGEPPEYTELVLLVHAGNPAEAELFKAELESHGIPAILEGEGAGVAGIPDVGAGVPVLVPEEFADQAAEFIAELESAKPEDEDVGEKEDIFDEGTGDIEDIEDKDVEELDTLDDDDEDEDLEDDDDWDDDWEDDEEEDEEWEDDDEDWEDEDDDWEDDDER
ncbi:MAG: DUF2007 domain-containing protein, partial [Planctomycetes bacterium]|nr:DUF2007 domain-containing protein [Planctomycetota bacterium]